MFRLGIRLLKQTPKSSYITQNIESRFIKRWVAPTLKELQRRRDKIGPPKPEPRSSYLEWNYDAELYAFGKRLNEDFEENILQKALTHNNYAMKQDEKDGIKLEDNTRLIEQGNDLINSYLNDEFSKKYPEILAKVLKDYLTTTEMLSYVASHIGLKDIVLCDDFPVEDLTLANTFCAIVAALEESSGQDRAKLFIKDILMAQLNGKDVYDLWKVDDAFSHLKDLLKGKDIEPRLCNSSASNTILANYQIGLYSDKKLLGIGFGEDVNIAKHVAALDAIQRIYEKGYK